MLHHTKLLFAILLVSLFTACHRPLHVSKTTGQVLLVDSTYNAMQDTQYLQSLAPIKEDLEKQLGAPIGYAPEALTVNRPECTMLNWACDALLAIAQKHCPNPVDMAVVNIGSMRCEWAAGEITFRNVFELMPFDNELVVLTLTGEEIHRLCEIVATNNGEGMAGLRLKARNGKVLQVEINGKSLEKDKTYTVATSDYLSQGNDGMLPLKNYIKYWNSEEKIRDLYIEYIKQVKVVQAKVDGRMDIQM